MEDGDIPPFWQPPATLTRRNRHRSSTPILNSSLLIILLPSIALLFAVFIIIPSIHKILPITNNTNTQNQKAISVKKSWDLVNIILVLFAILFGIFAKRNDDSSLTTIELDNKVQQYPTQTSSTGSTSTATGLLRRSKTMLHNYNPSSSSVPQWFEYSQQQRITTSPVNTPPPGTGISRLRRTVSSDPYLKYNSNNNSFNTGNSQFRFFDDLDISRFYPKDAEHEPQPAETTASMAEFEKTPVKDIEVDTSVIQNGEESLSPTFSPPQTPPRNPSAPSPPPPPPTKQRRTFQAIPRREQVPPSPPPPPPTPPSPPPRGREEMRRSSRKRMNATKEIATAIVYLYSQRKRKRRQQSQKSSRNFEDSSSQPENRSQFIPPPSPPPPPPPLPPHPSSAFKSWFKKGSKTKKIHSFSSIPKPPPPPIRQKSVKFAGKPPLPARRESGNESQMSGIPPSPPPPYKVRPEIDGRDEAMSSSSEMNGQDGERLSSVTCPSPDLNVKADSFIARHHDGWRLEKLNSWREKLNKTGNGPTF